MQAESRSALVQRFERPEELALALGDDVADVFFEPLLLLVGKGLRLRGRSGSGRKEKGEGDTVLAHCASYISIWMP